MKKNMKKVPIVQKKSENYHRHEEQEAEKIIEEQLQNNDEGMIMTETQTENNGGQKNENVFKKIVNYLKRYVKDFYNIKQKYNG
ncbi:hypothetical protein KKH82_08360 [Patescibacteria group bacterium]|nr:hypothetical protein [Patescibacteria group bacterium]